MPQIKVKINKEIFTPKLYPLLLDNQHRFMFLKGSAGSGKSYFATQKIIVRCLQEKIRVLVCRKYGTTIRNTCFSLFKQVIEDWGLSRYCRIRETDFDIQFVNGSEIIFSGLDTETKLLSLNNITVIFVEEVFEVERELFEQLNLRLRGGVNQQIIACFNPINKSSWLYDFCVVNPPTGLIFSETTYKDNPYLTQEYIDAIEDLKTRNPKKYRVYGLGEWGSDVEGLVFSNFEVKDFDPMEIAKIPKIEHRAGLDFGFIDPTAIVDSLYDRQNNTIYIFNIFYQSGCSMDQISKEIKEMGLAKTKIYCDSAEPRQIDYLKKQGFNAQPCIKGQGSVEARISFLQNNKIVILPTCEDIINEFENFSYQQDKNGKYIEGKYTHEFSHSIDALGYAYSDIYTKGRLKTIDKTILGL